MKSCDTNILFYAFNTSCIEHVNAKKYLDSIKNDNRFILSEYVICELFILLQNPKLLNPCLSMQEAIKFCFNLRLNPNWRIVESVEGAMDCVWSNINKANKRHNIFDYRIGYTLYLSGVSEFATRNTQDFKNIGFDKLINPID